MRQRCSATYGRPALLAGVAAVLAVRWWAYCAASKMAEVLQLADPLAHRALQALLRAENQVRRALATDLERAGISAAGFSALVVMTTAGGSLELRALRRRMGWSKANATEVTATLEARGYAIRRRLDHDKRAVAVDLTAAGRELVESQFPGHADRVTSAFSRLDEDEKRNLASICRKLAA